MTHERSTPHTIPCTVQVLTRNSMPGIERCLRSLTRFAEVMVQDGYSSDGTRDVAVSFPNVRLIDQNRAYLDADNRIVDFAAIRNESLSVATYDWVLVVDADEEIQDDLAVEVGHIVQCNEPGVYRVFRRFYVKGRRIDLCAGYPAYQIRFFHRALTDGYIKSVHEKLRLRPHVVVETLTAELRTPLPPPSDLEAKYRRYLELETTRVGMLPWNTWLRHVLYRNMRSAIGLFVFVLFTWIRPTPGKRMPFLYDWQAIRYSLRVIIATFPLRARRASVQ